MANDTIANLLHEAAETHHHVHLITDGSMINSHLVHALVQLDFDHAAGDSHEPWSIYFARRLQERFGPA